MNLLDPVFRHVAIASARGAFLILLLIGLRRPLRGPIAPRMFFPAWIIVAATLLAPWSVPVPWTPWAWPLRAPFRMVDGSQSVPAVLADSPAAPFFSSATARAATDPTTAARPDTARRHEWTAARTLHLAAIIWLAGVMILTTARAAGMVRFGRRLRRTARPGDASLQDRVADACAGLGFGRVPEVFVTGLVATPAFYGILRPRLLFPPGLAAQLDATELEFVVQHELGHLCRRDLWAQALLQAAAIVHWFNPAAWLAARAARLDCELACDELVLGQASPEKNLPYGRTLLKVLGAARGDRRLPATLGIVEGKRQLLTRITMITNYRRPTAFRTLGGGVLLSTIAVVGYTHENFASGPALQPPAMTSDLRQIPGKSLEERRYAMKERRAGLETWSDRAVVVLRAAGDAGGVPFAVMEVNNEPTVVKLGSLVAGSRVNEIDVPHGRVTLLTAHDTLRVIPLTAPAKPIVLPSFPPPRIAASVDRYLHDPNVSSHVPIEIMSVWRDLDHASKLSILLSYLRSGVVVGIEVDPSGLSGSASLLFEKQISERRNKLRDDFVASLTSGQQQRFKEGNVPAVRIGYPANLEQQIARVRQIEADQDAVVAELTPGQRKLYDAWHPGAPR